MTAERTATLFDAVRDSGLLEASQVEQLSRMPESGDPDPRALGKVLFQRGWLTKFQINLLAQGKAKDLVIGPYQLLDRLGEGGMGAVFKARHQHMNRVVALKVIRKEKLSSPDAVKRFYQEAQSAAKLQHPNIALAYDAGQAGAAHFLAMEYIDGADLSRLVKEKGPLPVGRACEYVRQAALGLQHAHEAGMVHRDIKPHNLMLTSKGEVKVLDFGLARLASLGEERGLTQTGAVVGTPDYLAPEQAMDSRKASIRSDLYSLGCTLYFLLAGRAPFHAESMTQLLLRHQMDEATPLSAIRPDVPEELDEVAERLLAKDPADRYGTPAELADDLAPFAGDDDGPAPAVAPVGGAGQGASSESWDTLAEGPKRGKAKTPSHDGTLAESGERAGPKAGLKRRKRKKAKKAPTVVLAVAGAAALVLVLGAAVTAAVLLGSGKPASAAIPVADLGTTAATAPATKPATPLPPAGTRPAPPFGHQADRAAGDETGRAAAGLAAGPQPASRAPPGRRGGQLFSAPVQGLRQGSCRAGRRQAGRRGDRRPGRRV